MKRGMTVLEALVVIVVIIILIALFVPSVHSPMRRARVTSCANNLTQMWKLENVYVSQFGGRLKAMPPVTGQAFWRALTITQPPIVDPRVNDLFLCPVLGTSANGDCDYRGPARVVSQLDDGDPVGADLPDNHKEGANDEGSGNVLRKSGDVLEYSGPDWVKITADKALPIK